MTNIDTIINLLVEHKERGIDCAMVDSLYEKYKEVIPSLRKLLVSNLLLDPELKYDNNNPECQTILEMAMILTLHDLKE